MGEKVDRCHLPFETCARRCEGISEARKYWTLEDVSGKKETSGRIYTLLAAAREPNWRVCLCGRPHQFWSR